MKNNHYRNLAYKTLKLTALQKSFGPATLKQDAKKIQISMNMPVCEKEYNNNITEKLN